MLSLLPSPYWFSLPQVFTSRLSTPQVPSGCLNFNSFHLVSTSRVPPGCRYIYSFQVVFTTRPSMLSLPQVPPTCLYLKPSRLSLPQDHSTCHYLKPSRLSLPQVPPSGVECEASHRVRYTSERNLLQLDEVCVPGEGEEVEVRRLYAPAVTHPVLVKLFYLNFYIIFWLNQFI